MRIVKVELKDAISKKIIQKIIEDINLYDTVHDRDEKFGKIISKDGYIGIEIKPIIEEKSDEEIKEYISNKIKEKVKNEGKGWTKYNKEKSSIFEEKISDIYYIYDVLRGRGVTTPPKESENKDEDNDKDKKFIESVLAEYSDFCKLELKNIHKENGEIKKIYIKMSEIYDGYKQELEHVEKELKERYKNLGEIKVCDIDGLTKTAVLLIGKEAKNINKKASKISAKESKEKLQDDEKMTCWVMVNCESDFGQKKVKMVRCTQDDIAKKYCKGDKKKALTIWGKLRELLSKPYYIPGKGIYRMYREPDKNINIIVSRGITESDANNCLENEVWMEINKVFGLGAKNGNLYKDEICKQEKCDTTSWCGMEQNELRQTTVIITENAPKTLKQEKIDAIGQKIETISNREIKKIFGEKSGIMIYRNEDWNDENDFCGQYVYSYSVNIISE